MCLSLLYIDYRVKPNFQSAALGTIAVGPRVTNFQIFLTYMTDFYIFSHYTYINQK